MRRNPSPAGHEPVQKNSIKTNLLVFVITCLVLFTLMEMALRVAGQKPGYAPIYAGFNRVDSLVVFDNFFTDGEGIFRANPEFQWEPDYRINSEGFRSPEFVPDDDGSVSVLILGDSFAWGKSASPISRAFPDLCAEAGIRVYNLGIPGTGPEQYAALAEKYVPRLRPDHAAVMFYLGNDFAAPYPMRPFEKLYHVTNAGWLYGFRDGDAYMTAQDAYDYYLGQNNAAAVTEASGNGPRSVLKKWVLKSAAGTACYLVFFQLRNRINASRTESGDMPEPVEKAAAPLSHTSGYLSRIRKVCGQNDVQFHLFIIPMNPLDAHAVISQDKWDILNAFDPAVCDSLTPEDYTPFPGQHFNNRGHEKYAGFVLKVLAE
ncbi:SGNH/GDSL hydrolase family protein [bacterium]|nr:SGNH/GDSL hydrolase family protein [bacterium]